ncbi:SET domain-containing protein-lysine N-methyltransferase [Paraburkholderia sp. A2RI-6]|uniref:SET domain-containing protein n=1 Tax=Paraburkholderia sp. A2RI-6 TaxID=3028371 RepID=UPI003B7B1491
MKRVSVRHSPIHGKGVFALRALAAGERILEYQGRVTSWTEAAHNCAYRQEEGHTFLFGLSDGRVIDGGRGGNSTRWLNHSCEANCEAVEQAGRIYIEATRDISAGEELFIDYSLDIPRTSRRRADYRCHCGARRCRGTMLRS